MIAKHCWEYDIYDILYSSFRIKSNNVEYLLLYCDLIVIDCSSLDSPYHLIQCVIQFDDYPSLGW